MSRRRPIGARPGGRGRGAAGEDDVSWPLALDPDLRAELWSFVVDRIEGYQQRVHEGRVTPLGEFRGVRSLVESLDFRVPMHPREAVAFAAGGFWNQQLHCAHRRYFGLFNPTPSIMGIVGEALAAGFNPQLAAWGHAPFAVEAEAHLVRTVAARFGYDPAEADGTVTAGGAEANHTALLTALTRTWPAWLQGGLRRIDARPALYVSEESHHSVLKAARACGLGSEAVRVVLADAAFRMDPLALEARLDEDARNGWRPFLLVATAGTTGTGAVDPLDRLAAVAEERGLWLHVDAAWGGAARLLPEGARWLAGVERADSVTVDPHKWLAVPLGAGLFLTRHRDVLRRTFEVETGYVPADEETGRAEDPYAHSIQWSRRFAGLKVILTLAVAGWDGYERVLRQQVAMGDLLRERLRAERWTVVNDTPLPVVCFVPPDDPRPARITALARHVVESGEAWISEVRPGGGRTALRACVTSHLTRADDVEALVAALDRARSDTGG